VTLDLEIGNGRRAAMGSTNRLKLGLFGANCSSGRAVTRVPERWSGSWPDCVTLAQMADRAGIEFMLPIGRWKGYGGDTDYQGATWETVAWACGLLAKTERLTVFGTVHAPLISPLIAAKEFVTAKDIGKPLVHRFVIRNIGKSRGGESDYHCSDYGPKVHACYLPFGIRDAG
jgi:hypothetical protein